MSTRCHFATVAAAVLGAMLSTSAIATAQGSGTEENTGDLFGDLVHIKRDSVTGQPILQKRWVLLQQDQPGWAYCPIPVDATGVEIPFADSSCDPNPDYLDQLVEVDYFGRLSGGRTKERNQRMHFDEVIDSIKAAVIVDLDEAGRIKIGTSCDATGTCAVWKTIDSPMENLALYRRVMKYGHLQTNPLEEDTDAHGDPALGTVYHPALGAEDWAKFRGAASALLPRPLPAECFSESAFVATCADPQSLTADDFFLAGALLGGAADKTGRITVDLVQYLNRILSIPKATPASAAAVDTLPALIRDESGTITPATSDLPAPANERFVDFSRADYLRTDRYSRTLTVLQTSDSGQTWRPASVNLLQWLATVNGPPNPASNMSGFVAESADALRAVQFIHEYEIPANLWVTGTATTTAVQPTTAQFRVGDQPVVLKATVRGPVDVNGGNVMFSVQTADGTTVGSPVTSDAVVQNAATATYTLPGGTAPQTLVVVAVYGGTSTFAPSAGTGSLVLGQAPTTTEVAMATAPASAAPQTVALKARVLSPDPAPVNGGTVMFVVLDDASRSIGVPVTMPVIAGGATANYTLPGGASGRYTIRASYSGTVGYGASIGSNTLATATTSLSVTALSASVPLPVEAGRGVVWTASVAGGVTPYTFRFLVFDGTAWSVGQDWSASNVFAWYPPAPGTYSIQVAVRNAGSTAPYDAQKTVSAAVTAPAELTITRITPSALSAAAGSPVIWTVTAAGGRAPYSYEFWIFDGTNWSLGRTWGTANTWTWTPAAAGTYRFQVWARNAGSTASYDAWRSFGPYTATLPSALTVTAVTSEEVSPVPPGTPVHWSANAVGGVQPYTFKFYVWDGVSWTVGQDWGAASTWTWVPPAPGSYRLQVWARNAGSVAQYDAVGASPFFTVGNPAPLKVTQLSPNRTFPVTAGTPVVWTAAATGGTGPYTFQFHVYDGQQWTTAQDWSTSPTFTWTPASAGTYHLQVWVRNAGSIAQYDAWLGTPSIGVTAPAALSVTSITTIPGLPFVTGGPATFIATATGGTGPYTYQFWVYDGQAWVMGRDWSTSNSWTWLPPGPGTYNIQVWVRNAGSTNAWDAWKGFGPFTVTP